MYPIRDTFLEIKSELGYMEEAGQICLPQPCSDEHLGDHELLVNSPVTEASLTGKTRSGNLEFKL